MKVLKELEFRLRVLLKRAYRPCIQKKIDYLFLGDPEDGGWPVYKPLIHTNSVIYSFGVGQNISWDEKMMQYFGVRIYSFDPNPDSINWLSKKNLPSGFKHFPYALGWINSTMAFYINNENIAGCSMIKSAEHHDQINVKCFTLATLMEQLNHSKIDVLKIDIEGAEYQVIENVLKDRVEIKQLLIEFHHRSKGDFCVDDTRKAIKMLIVSGYKVFWRSARGREVALIKEK